MKQLNFIMQAKGGVGKSLLSYLMAIAQESDESTLFVDADSSTKTSSRQLKFLGENRTEALSPLNEKEVLVRDNIISYLESLSNLLFQKVYLDFGAPESEQLPTLIERDLPFKVFTDELNFTVIFHIVIGGGGAYSASVDYLQKMMRALDSNFEVQVWQSITTFNNFQSLAEELKKNCDKLNVRLRPFGDFDPSSNLGSQILDGIRKGYGINDYQTGARIRLRKELNENFKDEYITN